MSEWTQLQALVREWKESGKQIVFSNGCFDVLHPGHTALLDFARKQGDRLIIGINSDRGVRALKGENRPVYPEMIRAKTLLACGNVDAVVIFDEATPLKIVGALMPDVLVKGGDYRLETIVGAREVLANGGKVLVFPRIPGHSTSKLLSDMRKKHETKQA
ncbi:MAG: adenylyltransferase/cytidyltransferase family protein [Candidatus Marinimicrobia bacterium]|nr:adenylyltransferase/cytidyltransferase family protein [Candidatus Neomarinimicrobiota bacterium]